MRWGGYVALVVVLILTALNVSGCRRNKVEKVEEWKPDGKTATAPRTSKASDPTPELIVSGEDEKPLTGLAHGTHMVFGIRLPEGMMPMSQQDKVKRFEGTHSVESVKAYILKQLAGKIEIRPNRFGGGYFIAKAIPASSQRDLNNVDMSARKFNIKIFDGSLGGAGVEIWEALPGEAETVASSRSHGGATLKNLEGAPGKTKAAQRDVPKVKYETRREKERATFDVFEKMSKGKPLTEADYQSPFFTEI